MSSHHPFMGYEIPVHLIQKTGAGPETFEALAAVHMQQLGHHAPIEPAHHVLELGCGIGRDAIPLTVELSTAGRYDGIDVDAESIEWCQRHVSARYPHFHFHHSDVKSPLYNPAGKIEPTEVRLPVADGSVDRAIAQSVFTHLLEDSALHHLRELHRVLKDDGRALTTFFIATRDEIELSKASPVAFFRFTHEWSEGCWINDRNQPEGSVAFSPETFERLLEESGLRLLEPIQFGHWLPRENAGANGQDIVVLGKRS